MVVTRVKQKEIMQAILTDVLFISGKVVDLKIFPTLFFTLKCLSLQQEHKSWHLYRLQPAPGSSQHTLLPNGKRIHVSMCLLSGISIYCNLLKASNKILSEMFTDRAHTISACLCVTYTSTPLSVAVCNPFFLHETKKCPLTLDSAFYVLCQSRC